MSTKGKSFGDESIVVGSSPISTTQQSQLDFELDFFAQILDRSPDYVDALRVHGNNLTMKGRFEEGLKIDRRLCKLRPADPLTHYNLACSYSLLKKGELALRALRRAIEKGYRDFRFMREDRDLEFARRDPKFRQLLREYENH